MKQLITLMAVLVLSLNVAHAQMSNKAIKKKEKKARQLYMKKNYEGALKIYNDLYSATRKEKYTAKIANVHYKLSNYEKVVEWYKKAPEYYKKDDRKLLQFAESSKMIGNFKDALNTYIYYAIENNDAESIYDKAYACENLLKAQKNAVLYAAEKLPPNTGKDEINIANFRNSFVFISNRPLTSGVSKKQADDFQDVYILEKEYNKWLPEKLLLRENDHQFNISSVNYTKDGNKVFYTISPYKTPKERQKIKNFKPHYRIMTAVNLGNKWQDVEEIPFNSDEFSCKDPFISADGKTLYFSSNREGGKGGYDIYYSTLKNEKWTRPKPIEGNINTEYNEENPYISESGHLNFSSNKPLGFGGYDIYRTNKTKNAWTEPELLPPPINSSYNDKGIIYEWGLNSGFFSSDRPGGKGGYDMYVFMPFDLKLEVSVFNESNGRLLDLAEVQLFRDKVLLGEALTTKEEPAILQVGKEAHYEIVVKKEGFLPKTKTINTFGKKNRENVLSSVQLKKDPQFIEAAPDKKIVFNNPNYIRLTATVKYPNENIIKNAEVNLINLNSGRLKILNTDKDGKFFQKLYLNNEYKVIVKHNGMKIENDLHTYGYDKAEEVETAFIFEKTKSVYAQNKKNKIDKSTENSTANKIKEIEKGKSNKKNIKEEIVQEELVQNIKEKEDKTTNKIEEKEVIVQNKNEKNKVKNEPENNQLVYKIQLGAYMTSSIKFNEFSDLGSVKYNKSSSGQFIYTLGNYDDLDKAKEYLQEVRDSGVPTAFIVCYFNNEKISIHR